MPNYSYSRLSTFKSCHLKYDLEYNRKIELEVVKDSETQVGTYFHEFMDEYAISNEKEVKTKLIENMKKNPKLEELIPTLDKAIEKYKNLYLKTIVPQIKAFDFNIEKEKFRNFKLENFNFVLKLDMLLYNKTHAIVIDHKTTKKLSNAKYYKEQLLLYKLGISKILNIPLENVSTFIFFPFVEEDWEESFVEIKTETKAINKFEKETIATIKEIEEKKDTDANLNFMCKFCKFAGFAEYCVVSVAAGMPRKRRIVSKKK